MADIKVNRVNRNFTIKVHLYFNKDSHNRSSDSTPRFYLKPVELLHVERVGFTRDGGANNNYLKHGNRFWKNKPDLVLSNEQCESIFNEIKQSYPYGYVEGDLASTNKYNFDVKKNEAFQSFYNKYWNDNSSKVVQNTIHNADNTLKYPHPYIEFTTNEIITYKYTVGNVPALPSGVTLDQYYVSGDAMYYTRPIEYTCHDEDATVTFDNALSRNHFVIDGMAKWPLTLSASGRYRFDIVSGGKPSRWPTGAGGSFNSHPFRFSTGKDGTNENYTEYTNGVSYVVSPETANFYVKVVTKTASTGPGEDAHYYMYSGSTSGYALSGSGGSAEDLNASGFGYDEGPVLTLRRDSTYRFYQTDASNSGHPLAISTHGSGQGYQTYSSGVTTATNWVEFTVPWHAPDRLYYTCKNHAYMGGPINIVDAPAAPKTGSIPGESIVLKNDLAVDTGIFYYCSGVSGIGNFVKIITGCGVPRYSGINYS